MTVKVTLRIEQKESGGDETYTAEAHTTWVTPVILRVMRAAIASHSQEFTRLQTAAKLIFDAMEAAAMPGGASDPEQAA